VSLRRFHSYLYPSPRRSSRVSYRVHTVIKIGSISDLWSKAIERVSGIPSEGEKRPERYRIWFDPSIRGGSERSDAENGNGGMPEVVPPEGMEFREAREEDIPIVSSTLPRRLGLSLALPSSKDRIPSLLPFVFFSMCTDPSLSHSLSSSRPPK